MTSKRHRYHQRLRRSLWRSWRSAGQRDFPRRRQPVSWECRLLVERPRDEREQLFQQPSWMRRAASTMPTSGQPPSVDRSRRIRSSRLSTTEGLHVIIPCRRNCLCAQSGNIQAAILDPTPRTDPALDYQNPNGMVPYGNLAAQWPLCRGSDVSDNFQLLQQRPEFRFGFAGPHDPDSWIYNGQATNFGQEWLVLGRTDFNLRSNDHLLRSLQGRPRELSRQQTSFLDPIFDAESPQPSYEGQLNETHTFTPTLTNQFLVCCQLLSGDLYQHQWPLPWHQRFPSVPDPRKACCQIRAGEGCWLCH